MRRSALISVGAVLVGLLWHVAAVQAVPSFPGAEGYGAITTGGRGGTVYEVTTLADSGPGSFRTACQGSGPRTVVFRVAGTINLLSEVNILNPYITIAGQTAPGGGVCIAGETLSVDTNDVIIRHMRIRRGNASDRNDDALGSDRTLGNVMVDHCSASWGMDENLSIYRWKTDAGKVLPTENVTIQYCISSEALDPSNHAFGGTWGGTMVSYHHNMFASNTGRNPSISWSYLIDFRNNVAYNWKHRTMDGAGAEAHVNVVNCYYKDGPATYNYVYGADGPGGTSGIGSAELLYRIVKPELRGGTVGYAAAGWWYVDGNYIDANSAFLKSADANAVAAVNADNWDGGVQFEIPGMLDEWAKATTPFAVAPIYTQTAQEAYATVLAEVGATRPGRDSVDSRIILTVTGGTAWYGQGGTGIINDPSQVGGWPTYAAGTPPTDSDHDGMPDAWEIAHGLDPNVASNNGDYDADGYTNIEEYINELGAFHAPKAIVWTGGTAGRYELTANWDLWQPSTLDAAEVNSGKATVAYIGQEAGTLYVGNTASSNGELAVTSGGKLLVADRLVLGNATGAKGTANLTGGSLVSGGAVVLASSSSSTGLLKVGKDAFVQVGGLIANTGSGRSSTIGVELDGNTQTLIHTTGTSTLGGVMDVQVLGGYRPREGDEFAVITSTDPNAVYYTGNFSTFTSNIIYGLPPSSAAFGGGGGGGAIYELVFLGYTDGDANGDHSVDGGDLALMGGNWNTSLTGWGNCDFNNDGLVDGGDLALLGGNWMWTLPGGAPQAPLPEPATLTLLALGATALVRRRR